MHAQKGPRRRSTNYAIAVGLVAVVAVAIIVSIPNTKHTPVARSLATTTIPADRPSSPSVEQAPTTQQRTTAPTSDTSTSDTPVSNTSTSDITTTVPLSQPNPLGAGAASYLSTRGGTVLAEVYDLNTSQEWSIGTGGPQVEASIVKVNILETLLDQPQADGGLSRADQSLATSMIEESDNDAATELWDSVNGAVGIQAYDSRAGLSDTTPSPCVQCPGFPWPGWGLSSTTPTDQITLLKLLVEANPILSSAERAYVLGLMENVSPSERWGVSAGVSPTATVALKNGWLPLNDSDTDWQINSIGWVSGLSRNYLVAVLTTGNPTEQYGIDTIDALSTMVWNDLG
jgi:Beta-lactamase enzyme family